MFKDVLKLRRSLKISEPLQNSGKYLPKLKATGILLAGGKSSRMKIDKAFLELKGQPLVERSLEVLNSVFEEVIISSNKPELYASYQVPVIRDGVMDRGPLEGLYQGLKAAAYDAVFFVACDLPFLQAEIIRFLGKWLTEYDIIVPRLGSGIHPLHAFYHRRCLPIIKNNLETGRLKIIDIYPFCSIRYIEEPELQAFGDLNKVFYNVNTPEDWLHVLDNFG